jgi:hypothetical protein
MDARPDAAFGAPGAATKKFYFKLILSNFQLESN